MVVIGIDFGNESCVLSTLQNLKVSNESCVLSTLQNLKVSAITNDYNNVKTPSNVAFAGNERFIGEGAKNQQATNLENTLQDIKVDLIEPKAHGYVHAHFISSDAHKYYVQYNNERRTFFPVQIVATLFSKLKADANAALLHEGKAVTSCVIAVPSYFTSSEGMALLLAAGIAGLECEFLIKETTAVAIAYGFNRYFSSTSNVVFIDFGHSSIQICAWAFSNKRLQILAEASEQIGGRDFDKQLIKHVIQKLSISETESNNQNFMHELSEEVKELKKKMSESTGKLPLNFRNVPEFRTTIKRSEMEAICKPLFDKITNLMLLFLTKSKLKPEEVQSIEVVGGSSRIPAFKNLVTEVFGKAPQATMNPDEAVSQGCFIHSLISRKLDDFIIVETPVDYYSRLPKDYLSELLESRRMKVGEIHRHFKGDKKGCLLMATHEFAKLVNDEDHMSISDKNQKTRRNARNKLDKFISLERKHGGMLKVIDDEMLRKVEFVKSWDNGTTKEYLHTLDELRQQVNEIRSLKQATAQNKLHDFLRLHEMPGGVLAQIHDQEKKKEFEHDKNWNNGSISEYNEKFETWYVYVDLCDFINTSLEEGEILKEDEDELKNQLRKTQSLPQTTIDEYRSILLNLRKFVKDSKEQLRQQARKSLIDFIATEMENDEILPETKKMLQKELMATESWVNGSTKAYQNKQTEISDAVKKSRDEEREKARIEMMYLVKRALAEGIAKGEMLEHSKLELKKTVKHLKTCNNKTVTQYKEKVQEVEKALENAKEEFRCDRREKLLNFIEDSSSTLTSLNDTNLLAEVTHIRSSRDEDAAYYESKLDELKKLILALILAENQRVDAHLKLVKFVNLNNTFDKFRESIKSALPSGVLKIEDWTKGTSEEYKFVYEEFIKIVEQNENQRIKARNKLLHIIEKGRKAGGILETIEDSAIKDKLRKIEVWVNGTKEEYDEELISVTQYAKNERERREARKNLYKFFKKGRQPSGDLFNVSDVEKSQLDRLEKWRHGTTKEYIDEFQKWSKIAESFQKAARNTLYDFLRLHERPGGVLAQIRDQEKKKEFEHDKNWNNGSISEYVEKYETWTIYVQNVQRRNALQELYDFINTSLREGKILMEDEEKLRKQLRETKSSPQTTTEEIKSILLKSKEIVKNSKEQLRNQVHKSLIDYIVTEMENDGMLPETKNMLQKEVNTTQSWVDGSTKAYKKKQAQISDAVKKSTKRYPLEREKVRNEIIYLIERALAEGKMLEYTKLELKKTIKEVKKGNNSTLGQYNEKLHEVKKTLENAKEEFRCDRREKLLNFIEDSSSTLTSLNDTNLLAEVTHIRSSRDEDAAYYESKLDELKKLILALILAENQRVDAHLKLVKFVNLNNTFDKFRESIKSALPSGVLKIEDWKDGTFEEYNSVHEKVIDIVEQNENQRIEARNKLLCFIKEERKEGGTFRTIEDPAIGDELNNIDVWVSGTKEQYDEKLISVTQLAENERERRKARKNLRQFLEKERQFSGNLFNTSNEEEHKLNFLEIWHNGSTKEYIYELQKWSKNVDGVQKAARNKLHDFLRLHEMPGGVLAQIHDQEKKKEFEHDKNWNNGSINEYKEKYEIWTVYVQNVQRRNALQELSDFINTSLEEGKILIEDEEKLRKQLRETKALPQTTTEEFQNILLNLKGMVTESKEFLRKQAHQSLIDCIKEGMETDEMLQETKNMLQNELVATEFWVDGSTKEYQKKQTEICEKVKRINVYITLSQYAQEHPQWLNDSTSEYIDQLEKWAKYIESVEYVKRIEVYKTLCQYVEKHPQLVDKISSAETRDMLKNIQAETSLTTDEYLTLLQEMKSYETEEIRCSDAHQRLLNFIEEERRPGGKLQLIYDKALETKIDYMWLWKSNKPEYFIAEYHELNNFFNPNNTTLLFGFDSIEKWKKIIESCSNKNENVRLKDMMAEILSFYTTRVPRCHITDSERTDIEEQMEKTVNRVDLAVNGRLFAWNYSNQFIDTAESEHLLLVRLVYKILQRREK